jgi:hypothetical protein
MATPKSFHEMMADAMAKHERGGGDGADMPDGEDDGPDYGGGYKSAVSDFIDAVHGKDVDAAADALESAIALCKPDDGKEPGDDDVMGGGGGGGHAALLLMPHGKGGH